MENASKALIIAGAILLAILLISLGIMIFNQAQDTVSSSGMSQAEMQTFNNKFLKYEGTISGSQAKALINEVLTSNATSVRQVTLGGSYTTTTGITSSSKYSVTLGYDNGVVSSVSINDPTTTTP